jgi:hypothetical protein
MASKTTLNAKNLKALGAARLSELLIEVTKGDAEAKRRLRFELAGNQSAAEVAREVRKRLTTIGRSQSFVDWHKAKALVKDLNLQRSTIVSKIAKDEPQEALELMWRFMGLAGSVVERCDDSGGALIYVFHEACAELGKIAVAASREPTALADQVFDALAENDYGQYDYLIEQMAPALSDKGLDHLKQLFTTLSAQPIPQADNKDREVIGYATSGPIYADDYAARHRETTVRLALQTIADMQNDVDAYIAQQSDEAKAMPRVAADIAARLLAVGRPEEAWTAVNAADLKSAGWIPMEWELIRVEVLEALGRGGEAQEYRWTCFEQSLSVNHLRPYLKRLPDFDDIEAEERAMVHVLQYPSIHQALSFLINWPALDRAAELVLHRARGLDGDHYHLLTPAADALEGKHPLAATLLRRALIDFALEEARSSRYRHAARHLLECQSLAGSIEDYGPFETHEAYRDRLRVEHGRKSSFWSLVP